MIKMNIIDVGAGLFQNYKKWLCTFPLLKIYVFEPHPNNYKKIVSIKNGMTESIKPRLILFNKAITLENGKKKFYMSNDINSSSLLQFNKNNIKKWKYPMGRKLFNTIKIIEIDCVNLGDIISNLGIHHIELLNIDTQGDADIVLKSIRYYQYNTIKKIIVKAHTDIGFNIYHNQCFAYDIVQLLKRKYFYLFETKNMSRNQEQKLVFINEPMQNRKTVFLNL